jgi:hypothetical protein
MAGPIVPQIGWNTAYLDSKKGYYFKIICPETGMIIGRTAAFFSVAGLGKITHALQSLFNDPHLTSQLICLIEKLGPELAPCHRIDVALDEKCHDLVRLYQSSDSLLAKAWFRRN